MTDCHVTVTVHHIIVTVHVMQNCSNTWNFYDNVTFNFAIIMSLSTLKAHFLLPVKFVLIVMNEVTSAVNKTGESVGYLFDIDGAYG